ncbi:hypothetical protein A2Z56_02145 [Candidatus Kaiserbacteria bacterium RIFCSPHIGHO2_12_45_16]|nr:MAG: hypothetical protein A2Z56_02145 [Candidatus Kaiserbacteria bacterium RIFCSPHIGHO2_12_45_16]
MSRVSNALAGHFIMKALCALHDTGILEYLGERNNGATVEAISLDLAIDKNILESLLDFLVVNVPEFFEKKDGLYTIKSQFYESSVQNSIYFALAYEDVLNNLPALLSKTKKYGIEVARNGKYLSKSSTLHNHHAWPAITDFIKEYNFETVIDLGCGAGDFLKHVAKTLPAVRLIGVEQSTEAAGITKDDKDQSIKFINGDAGTPEVWAKDLSINSIEKTLFVSVTVWHEFLWSGEAELQKVFSKYHNQYKGATLLLVEKNGYSLNSLKVLPDSLKDVTSVYQLIHPITNQGLPQSPAVWRSLIESSAVSLQTVLPAHPDISMYVCKL